MMAGCEQGYLAVLYPRNGAGLLPVAVEIAEHPRTTFVVALVTVMVVVVKVAATVPIEKTVRRGKKGKAVDQEIGIVPAAPIGWAGQAYYTHLRKAVVARQVGFGARSSPGEHSR